MRGPKVRKRVRSSASTCKSGERAKFCSPRRRKWTRASAPASGWCVPNKDVGEPGLDKRFFGNRLVADLAGKHVLRTRQGEDAVGLGLPPGGQRHARVAQEKRGARSRRGLGHFAHPLEVALYARPQLGGGRPPGPPNARRQ